MNVSITRDLSDSPWLVVPALDMSEEVWTLLVTITRHYAH